MLDASAIIWDIFTTLMKNKEIKAICWIDLRIGSLDTAAAFYDRPNWKTTFVNITPDESRQAFINAEQKKVNLTLNHGWQLITIHIEKTKTEFDIYFMDHPHMGIQYVIIFNYYEDCAIRIWLYGNMEYMPKTLSELNQLFDKVPEKEPHEYYQWIGENGRIR